MTVGAKRKQGASVFFYKKNCHPVLQAENGILYIFYFSYLLFCQVIPITNWITVTIDLALKKKTKHSGHGIEISHLMLLPETGMPLFVHAAKPSVCVIFTLLFFIFIGLFATKWWIQMATDYGKWTPALLESTREHQIPYLCIVPYHSTQTHCSWHFKIFMDNLSHLQGYRKLRNRKSHSFSGKMGKLENSVSLTNKINVYICAYIWILPVFSKYMGKYQRQYISGSTNKIKNQHTKSASAFQFESYYFN